MFLTKKIGCSCKARISRSADDDFIIAESHLQLFDYCFGRVYLTDTDGVKPDTPFVRVSPVDPAEALRPAGPVAPVPEGPIYDHGTVCQAGK
jgi:hypothetical protein